jgi:hypothetical protein
VQARPAHTAPELYELLVGKRGWTRERCSDLADLPRRKGSMMMGYPPSDENSPRRAVTLVASALAAAALLPAVARADGLPVLGIDVGASGVASRADDARYVTVNSGSETVVSRVDPHGGRLLSSTFLPGTFTVPAVAYDGSAGGLSANGQRLVLIEPRQRFPRATTRLALLQAPKLISLATIDLQGDFSFDAVSPDGTRLYLIQYTSPTDPTRYLVRAYDLDRHRLLAGAIRDPAERGDAMRGSPVTRSMSPDGRWAYTLYDGAGGTPFVHALDTRRGRAHCIDLPALAGANLAALRLRVAGATLSVRRSHAPVATIDLHTFHVAAAPSTAAPAREPGSGETFGWIAALTAGLAAIVGVLRWRMRKPRAAPTESTPANLA